MGFAVRRRGCDLPGPPAPRRAAALARPAGRRAALLGALALVTRAWLAPPLAAADAGPGMAMPAAWTEPARAVPPAPALPPPIGPVSPAHKYFTDVELVDQDGRTRRLYSDLLAGKIVVVEAFFTSCTTACPVLAERLAALQESLGDRLGREVYLLSISVDPQLDTPDRLKRYAESLGARPGWIFLTGKRQNVDWALYKLGSYLGPKEVHSNLLVLGNEPAGVWKKVFGLAPAASLIRSLDSVLRDRG